MKTDYFDLESPFDGEGLACIKRTPSAEAEELLEAAAAIHRARKNRLDVSERAEILHRASHELSAKAADFAWLIAREGGKPLVDAEIEVDRAADGLRLCAEVLRAESGKQIPMNGAGGKGRLAFTQLEPIGPVVAISAFNHPLNLVVHQIGPAVATGCPVIAKPAVETPLSCLLLVDLLRRNGLPDELCRVVLTDDNAVAEALATDPRVAFLTFIGSPRVGWMLRSKVAAGTRCALEHGGAAPVIITEDADLGEVIPLLAKGGFYHSGQVCVSVQRIFAERGIARRVAEMLASEARKLTYGDPTRETTGVGPLIRPREVERIEAWVAEAANGGGEILCGGKPIGARGYEPTVVLNPPDDVRLSREEAFGPVICVYGYDEIEVAVARANALPFAFQAAVCTRDLDLALEISQALEASAVMINDHTAFRVDWMPFAGLRQSGLGVGGIYGTMHDMQVEKMIVFRSSRL